MSVTMLPASGSTATAIAEAFDLGGVGALSGPVARGQIAQIWRLETELGVFAVKDWFSEPDVARVEQDADFSETVRARGVHTPRVVRTSAGTATAWANGRVVRVFEWMDLRPRSRFVDPGEVGRLLARLHLGAPMTDGAVDEWFSTGLGEAGWREIHRRTHEAGAPFAAELGALVPELVAVESVIEPHSRRLVCHRDLWADNVLVDGHGRLCVIDFENAGPADPAHEVAMALFEFGCDDQARTRQLYDSYLQADGPARVTRLGHFTMLVAELAHIARYACTRWLEEDDPLERDRLAAWVAEIPQEPVTLPRLARILDAIA